MRIIFSLLAVAFLSQPALAVKVADITRLGGQRTNVLTGVGLVYGLKGTGDGGDFGPAIKPLAAMLSRFNNPTLPNELKNATNVAIVSLIATVPSTGVRDGDHIDVRVISLGKSSSLRGGHSFVTPMQGPMPEPMNQPRLPLALCEGPIVLEDPTTPTVGVIKGGCVMEADLPAKVIENNQFTLILEDPSASWTISSTIAKVINDSEGETGEVLATAIDAKNILVTIPAADQQRPDSFISRVQRLPVPQLPTEARVVINEKTGTIIITGDVEITPCVISHKGLTISTIDPKPVATPRNPVVAQRDVVAMDTTQQGGPKLQDLALAFDQLKVPPEDRIFIVKDLYRSGKLHAKLIVNGSER